LAERCPKEARSREFEEYAARNLPVAIGRLTMLELRCLFAAFEEDVRAGALTVHPLEDAHAAAAVEIVARLKAQPLRSLDALHLAIALQIGATEVATADRAMAVAAAALGLKTVRFD
jgi:predicted nucleic acid-binding protein